MGGGRCSLRGRSRACRFLKWLQQQQFGKYEQLGVLWNVAKWRGSIYHLVSLLGSSSNSHKWFPLGYWKCVRRFQWYSKDLAWWKEKVQHFRKTWFGPWCWLCRHLHLNFRTSFHCKLNSRLLWTAPGLTSKVHFRQQSSLLLSPTD